MAMEAEPESVQLMTDWIKVLGIVTIIIMVLLFWRGFGANSYAAYGGTYFDGVLNWIGIKIAGGT